MVYPGGRDIYNAGGNKLRSDYYTYSLKTTIPLSLSLSAGDINNTDYSPTNYTYTGTAYVDNKEYNTFNGNSLLTTLQRVYNSEGFADSITATIPKYKYYRRDHLGNNRELWVANTKKTIQRTQYYPSGLPWASNSGDNPGAQERKYNGKEFVEMHGYDTYDYGARGYYPAMGRFMSVDPLAEDHCDISPYSYCGGDPINRFDPDGRDYWSTSDPATIERFINSLNQIGENQSKLSFESFNYGSWNHATDAEFTKGLTYNDKNQTFYSSYGSVDNGQAVIHGIQIKASTTWDGGASVETEKGKWYDKSSGAINQVNVEFAAFTAGSKPGLGLLKWTWNNVLNPPPTPTINTFNANAGKSFRPGKQNSRDANLKQFPKDFQRWFHRFGKEDGNFNATTQELREMFDEWIRMGKPQTK